MSSHSLLQGLAILLFLQWISTLIISFLQIPFPPALLGMLLLALLLATGIIRIATIEDICNLLIEKMGMLFLPAGVSMLLYLDVIKAEFSAIALTIIVSSFAVLLATALFLEIVLRRQAKKGGKL